MSNNLVKDMSEFAKLVEVPTLEELNFVGELYYPQLMLATRK